MRSPNQKLENFSVYLTILLSKGNAPLKIVTQIDLLDTLLKIEKEENKFSNSKNNLLLISGRKHR